MSTGLIIVIVAVALLLLALLLFVLPRARARSLEGRRGEVADAHRERAETRMTRAQEAEQIAARERAEADLHETRARMHERGLADADLDADRDRVVEGDGSAVDGGSRSERDSGSGGGREAGSRVYRNHTSGFERGRAVGARRPRAANRAPAPTATIASRANPVELGLRPGSSSGRSLRVGCERESGAREDCRRSSNAGTSRLLARRSLGRVRGSALAAPHAPADRPRRLHHARERARLRDPSRDRPRTVQALLRGGAWFDRGGHRRRGRGLLHGRRNDVSRLRTPARATGGPTYGSPPSSSRTWRKRCPSSAVEACHSRSTTCRT